MRNFLALVVSGTNITNMYILLFFKVIDCASFDFENELH